MGRYIRWLRARVGKYLRDRNDPYENAVLNIGYSNGGMALDALRLVADGSVIISGWTSGDPGSIRLMQSDREVPVLHVYRLHRPDVLAALQTGDAFLGFELRFQPLDPAKGSRITVHHGDRLAFETDVGSWQSEPPYAELRSATRIFGRNDIYGSGPPVAACTAEVLSLVENLEGRTLDFGCGAGYLVSRMRAAGVDAFGIEIDRPQIHAHLIESVKPFVQFTDGTLPLPYANGEFANVVATEVVEHVDDPLAVVAELARICGGRLIITVPDASAIPDLSYENVVPWHLLEATHLSFFTISSLRTLLAPHFSDITFAKIGRAVTNGTPWYTSIVAMCRK